MKWIAILGTLTVLLCAGTAHAEPSLQPGRHTFEGILERGPAPDLSLAVTEGPRAGARLVVRATPAVPLEDLVRHAGTRRHVKIDGMVTAEPSGFSIAPRLLTVLPAAAAEPGAVDLPQGVEQLVLQYWKASRHLTEGRPMLRLTENTARVTMVRMQAPGRPFARESLEIDLLRGSVQKVR